MEVKPTKSYVYKKSGLNEICYLRVRELEKIHSDWNLRTIFSGHNPKNEEFMYARFVKNRTDELIATVAFFDPNIMQWVPQRSLV